MKNFNSHSMIFLFAFLTMVSCKKSTSTDSVSNVAPTNLQVYAAAAVDGSGLVRFIATADNAVTYNYNFGNGDSTSVMTDSTKYTYTLSGTNTYTVTVTAVSSNGLSIQKSVQIGVYVKASSNKLVWSDEFNTVGLPDSTKWGYDLGAGGWGNNELQFYTNSSNNAKVVNGNLVLTAIKENLSGSNYTSARLLTKNKFAFTYGRIDIRAKLPASKGTWPAIWMLGNNVNTAGWPACGEMDIMEQKGNQVNTIYGTIHYPGHSGGGGVGSTTVIADATSAFHVYSLEWSPSIIKMYVDSQLFFSFNNDTSLPFNQNFFVILNLAMGGNFGGNIDSGFTTDQMLVDYVRVYK